MTKEMQVLLDAIEAERRDWVQAVARSGGDQRTQLIALSCGAVLGGLSTRLADGLAALEARQTWAPLWQNVSDLRGGVTE